MGGKCSTVPQTSTFLVSLVRSATRAAASISAPWTASLIAPQSTGSRALPGSSSLSPPVRSIAPLTVLNTPASPPHCRFSPLSIPCAESRYCNASSFCSRRLLSRSNSVAKPPERANNVRHQELGGRRSARRSLFCLSVADETSERLPYTAVISSMVCAITATISSTCA